MKKKPVKKKSTRASRVLEATKALKDAEPTDYYCFPDCGCDDAYERDSEEPIKFTIPAGTISVNPSAADLRAAILWLHLRHDGYRGSSYLNCKNQLCVRFLAVLQGGL